MDPQLIELMDLPEGASPGEKAKAALRRMDDATGQIETGCGTAAHRYTLKPLNELYGAGHGADGVDPEDERFMPLFLMIEQQIAGYYAQNRNLTDGAVDLMLDRFAMDPQAAPDDALSRRLATGLRLCLSLNDYSRQEVKAALKKIRKSVERHTRAAGPRGYLDFIVGFFG